MLIFSQKKQIMQSKPLPTILYYILYGQPLMNIVEYCRCSIHTFSLWNYFVRKIPNHDCCCLTFEIRSIVHLDCFSKYDFNLQSMVYKKKVLVIGYWVRSSNNHSPKLPFLHISFVQRHLFLLPRNILWFGWMLARKNFFGHKSKTFKSAKNIEIHKNSSRVTIWSLKLQNRSHLFATLVVFMCFRNPRILLKTSMIWRNPRFFLIFCSYWKFEDLTKSSDNSRIWSNPQKIRWFHISRWKPPMSMT